MYMRIHLIMITGDDYRSGYYTQYILRGSTTASISIRLYDDNVFELNETFSVTFFSKFTTCGVEEDPVDCMTVVTIVDNDGK